MRGTVFYVDELQILVKWTTVGRRVCAQASPTASGSSRRRAEHPRTTEAAAAAVPQRRRVAGARVLLSTMG
jgi:hypothetical protein